MALDVPQRHLAVPTAGPLALDSAAAKAAIEKSLSFLEGAQGQGQGFAARAAGSDVRGSLVPQRVEVDELGMTHVRMDRTHEGVKVLGEQLISHLNANGEVARVTGDLQAIPKGLGSEPTKLDAAKATEIAGQLFAKTGRTPEKAPVVERVIAQDKDGNYRAAFRVELQNLYGGGDPMKANFLVDANSGEVFGAWNQVGGLDLGAHRAAAAAAEPVTVTKTAEPNSAIADFSTVTSKLSIDDDITADQLKLSLNIPHTAKGDLQISLTSPSGKSVVVHDRKGGLTDNVIGDFDLSQAFAGEKAKGEWTLTVKDMARADVGTLKSWSLSVTGKPAGGPVDPGPGPVTGTADDSTLYSGKVDIKTTKNADGTFSLVDKTRPAEVETRDAQRKEPPNTGNIPSVAFKDNNDVWGEATDPANAKPAVDAHYGGEMTLDFYRDILGRNSIDGRGEKLLNIVNVKIVDERGNIAPNAFWDGEKMNYGIGDGRQAGDLTSLDIAGHEITHGLTERTANLEYRNESGGLNESMSDIMGTGVEWYASQKNPSVQFDWKIGEDVWTPNTPDDALRYMNDPTKDGYSIDHYSKMSKFPKDDGRFPPEPDNGGVHGSSGIMNNAFYLLVNGGTNRTSGMKVEGGIGMEKGLKIFGRALINYMRPNTDFKGARQATIDAATDLFGKDSVEVQKLKQSWGAVGVQ